MSAIEVTDHRTRTVRFRWVSITGSLIAAALFLGSAVLQVMASLQRWVVFRGSRTDDELSVEDHVFDYSLPWPPWEPIGTAAELFGAGTLLLALGVLVMPLSVSVVARTAARRGVAVGVGIVLAILVAGSFGIFGVHALISGLAGAPSPLRHFWALGWVGLIGLIGLSVLWGRISRAAPAIACVFLIGSTWPLGWIGATYVIAPIIGGSSHDTAPWSETVFAASPAAAGVAMIVAAWMAARRRATETFSL
ncbi:hypothetical protein [Salinibacterium sp. ZJ450]|uniref:hypothetical protein n=1 Tax=Salinibacterium sp. ZJ450 TaxID=2708338 RepID=UPI00141D80A6|nr:hypothetical protein [Salinibacterium sp. ZJ450]